MMKLFDDLDNTLVDPTPSQIRDFILNLTRGDAFAIFELDDQLEKLSELVRAFVVKGD